MHLTNIDIDIDIDIGIRTSSRLSMPDPGLSRAFDNIINFRDVGQTVNTFAGKRYANTTTH